MDAITLDLPVGDALLVVPPFASTNMPYLGVHVLQACARQAGFRVSVLYANLLYAALLGEDRYEALCRGPVQYMLGERLFASAAYGMPHLGRDRFLRRFQQALIQYPDKIRGLDVPTLLRWSQLSVAWVEGLSDAICALGFRVVGSTTTFEQTASSVALLNSIKRKRPETTVVLGGANCDGTMADGVLSLRSEVEYVFSGESEDTFPRFLRDALTRCPPTGPIIRGEPCRTLDALPRIDPAEFFEQRRRWLPDRGSTKGTDLWVSYETSRGCWWGQKHQCTFCGLNGQAIEYRQKSPDRVLEDLRALVGQSPTRRVCMTDNNMPHDYVRTFLPRLAQELPGLQLFYELKSNLSRTAVETLRRAGVGLVQPGIESLSTPCLQLMGKGVTARQNIDLLRFARAAGVGLSWNILFALPGDRIEDYERMLALIPLLRHLQPPLGVSHLSLERFSRYFMQPEHYDISSIRPLAVYGGIFPRWAKLEQLAYHFAAEYPSESRSATGFMKQFEAAVESWRESWRGDQELPSLGLTDLGHDCYLLLDTRGLPGSREVSFLSVAEAAVAVLGAAESSDMATWALERRLLADVDGIPAPLVTADSALVDKLAQTRLASAPGQLS